MDSIAHFLLFADLKVQLPEIHVHQGFVGILEILQRVREFENIGYGSVEGQIQMKL